MNFRPIVVGCFAVIFAMNAYSQEPVLSWTIQRIDVSGKVLPKQFSQSNLDSANLQARTLCDPAQAKSFKWPVASSVLVTVRPISAKPDDPRKRTATVPCSDYAANPRALEKYISRPMRKPPPEKKLIQLWD